MIGRGYLTIVNKLMTWKLQCWQYKTFNRSCFSHNTQIYGNKIKHYTSTANKAEVDAIPQLN